MIKGYTGRVLVIDLANKTSSVEPLSDQTARLYIGGRGLGSRRLYDECPAGADPLGPDNPLIFSVGPLTGSVAPQSNRFVVTTKSPLTGGVADSHCGGSFATGMKKAGYDQIVIRGKAKTPTMIELKDDKVTFKSAAKHWGKGTYAFQEEVVPKGMGCAVIGPAGENQVRFAGIVSDERIAGRGGTGAVMGSKNLKAIYATGRHKLEMEDPEAFKEDKKQRREYFRNHPMLGDILPRLGTASIVAITNARGLIPTHNFKYGRFEGGMALSGEKMADGDLVKKGGCIHCPILCARVVRHSDGKVIKGPEYETLGLLGANLETPDIQYVYDWNYIADDMGMDSISLGGVLGFAMELTERGMMKSELKFGRPENVGEMMLDIAHRRGLGNDLAEGVMRMAETYGGADFAIHARGMELPAYDPRGCWGQGLEYVTNNRGGCHVRGSTMYLEATGPFTVNPHTVKSKPELAIMQQDTNAYLNSLVLCTFTSYGMIPGGAFRLDPNGIAYKLLTKSVDHLGPVLALLITKRPKGAPMMWWEKWMTQITGMKTSNGHVLEWGARIYNLERMFNLREGQTAMDDRLPARLRNESIYPGIAGGHPTEAMLPRYYKLRGWDAYGEPMPATLRGLDIQI